MKKPDPRAMLLIVFCFSIAGVLIDKTWLLFAALVFTAVFVSVLGVKLYLFLAKKKAAAVLGLLFIVALLQSIFQPAGAVILKIGFINILTSGGLIQGANTLLRLGIVAVSATAFTLTTSRNMMQGLIQLKIPYELAFMATVSLRFLPAFTDEFRDTVTAIQLRGVDLKKIPAREKLKIYISILTPVVYGAVDRAQKLSCAVELRAFRALPKRTSRFILKFSPCDYVYIFSALIFTASVLICYCIF